MKKFTKPEFVVDIPDASTLPDASSPLFALYLAPREESVVRPFPAHRHHNRMCDLAVAIVRGRHGATVERAVANRARELTIQLVPLSVALRDLDEFEATLRGYVGDISVALAMGAGSDGES
ncbi:hypothetical protein JQ506_13015 [Shinella sp. PSBB067]|uniref:hypothetical protein n=1 Tax=Shinella sp. PSBB067 TaxID=2715959 RepID=UPI00193B2975|nr:hypothetical protein [Shinella sp. PSBB067]QRI61829.1 hypothetical protein JQ506_13015 [Shinella sp. PSBB067]